MYLLYVDASGTPELSDHTDVYAVVGLAVNEGSWVALERKVRDLKRRYGLHTTGGELHAKDFCVSIKEQDEVPDFESLSWPDRKLAVEQARDRKLASLPAGKTKTKKAHYRNTAPFSHLTRAERSQLLVDALDLIGGDARLRLFGEAITKRHARDDMVRQAFQQVVTRFEYYLERRNNDKRNPFINKGLLVMDNEPSREDGYRRMLESFRSHSHPWGVLRNVIESPFFADSRNSGALQLADVAAYALRRYLQVSSDANSHELRNFQRIYGRFDRERSRLHGVRHYCQPGSCACLVCRDRGHG